MTEIPDLQGIPGLQSKIDRMLQCQFVPRRLAWHLACSCRTLRDLGMALPLLQPLVLKLASEAAACQMETWQHDSDEEGEDEDGDYIPPRGLVSLRLLAAREVRSRLADLHISHDHQHLRKFMELAAHVAIVSYRTGAADYGKFHGDARLAMGCVSAMAPLYAFSLPAVAGRRSLGRPLTRCRCLHQSRWLPQSRCLHQSALPLGCLHRRTSRCQMWQQWTPPSSASMRVRGSGEGWTSSVLRRVYRAPQPLAFRKSRKEHGTPCRPIRKRRT